MSIDKSDPNVARESTKHPSRNVAVVGIFDATNRILLVRTKRFPDHWQPVGGGMKPMDSSPIDTLIRELREEMGIEFKPQTFKPQITTNYDFGAGHVFFYVASLPPNVTPQFDAGELIEWNWFPLGSLDALNTFPATKQFFSSLKSSDPQS
jgi:8-oxo-dGTP pyrophosphatase MutT (NUDIX family)